MKRIIVSIFLFSIITIICGCSLKSGMTPREKVSEFLDSYKNQDKDVIDDLEEVISTEYEGDTKERYKNIMINQYKNLDYDITDEIIDGNNALVTVDITVFDYSNAINDAEEYLTTHEKEFYKENETKEQVFDNKKFLEYKLDLLEKVTDKKTYTIEFSLNYDDNEWKLDSLTDTDIEKIHGIYKE